MGLLINAFMSPKIQAYETMVHVLDSLKESWMDGHNNIGLIGGCTVQEKNIVFHQNQVLR